MGNSMSAQTPPIRHQPKVILVTGGAGFIGSNFLLYMVPRYPAVQFINLDSLTYAGNLLNLREIEDLPNYRFVRGDVADGPLVERLFREHGITTVVHFAAESHVDRSIMTPLSFVLTNTVGTVTLLEAARKAWGDHADPHRFRFYHISTDEVFGSLGPEGYFTESTPYNPRSPYAASKAASDHFVRAYWHTYGLPVVLSNCSNNYGPYQFPEKLIPLVILNALENRPIPIYGQGENVRDWLYVRDHCTAIERILLSGQPGQTYLVSAGCERKNLELVQQLLDLIDEELKWPIGQSRRLITFVKDRLGHDFRYALDASRLRQELGWKPAYTLEEGLRETVRWYLTHRNWLEAVTDASYRAYYEKQYALR